MDILTAIQANLLSPAVLFFVLGLIAALTKSDLKFPELLYVGLTSAATPAARARSPRRR